MKVLVFVFFIIATSTSHATESCTGAKIWLNEKVSLYGDGIKNFFTGETYYSISDLEKDAIERRANNDIEIKDSNDKTTHIVRFLGAIKDTEGTFTSTFVVKDSINSKEKVFVLNSRYEGNGKYREARDSEEPISYPDQTFESLEVSGCPGVTLKH